MAERRENSVLFSLKELRGIEDGRVKKEKEEAAARLEADRAAKAAAERSAREGAERARREEEDRLRRIEEEKEGVAREEQMRLQEAERRHRVEGELRIQEERMRLEANARVVHKSPVKAIASITAVLIVIAGGLGYKMYGDHQAELAVERANAQRIADEAKAAQLEFERRLAAVTSDMNVKLAKAQTEEERAKIREQAAKERAALAQAANSGSRRHSSSKSDSPSLGAPRPNVKKHEVSDDPLEGIR
jgi:hypothetical protein